MSRRRGIITGGMSIVAKAEDHPRANMPYVPTHPFIVYRVKMIKMSIKGRREGESIIILKTSRVMTHL